MMFIGSRFCGGCGAEVEREELEGPTQHCPRCAQSMARVRVGATPLQECGRCGGVWVEVSAFERVCRDGEAQAAVLGLAGLVPGTGAGAGPGDVRYVPCPQCAKLMNRVNFARCSGIVVDVCRTHGTWFDRDELRGIVTFLRAGGMDVARERERERLEEERRRLEQAQRDVAVGARGAPGPFASREPAAGLAVDVALSGLLRLIGLTV